MNALVDGVEYAVLHPPAKRLRAALITEHVRRSGGRGVVCFTSGNAGAALRAHGLDVLTVGPGEDLLPGRWWQPYEVARAWPDRFDATSGHLPMPLMLGLARLLRDHLGPLPEGPWLVPTGSGETLWALSVAYPSAQLIALVNIDSHTEHHEQMPLAPLVARHRIVDGKQARVELV